jgi:hypothetical protein
MMRKSSFICKDGTVSAETLIAAYRSVSKLWRQESLVAGRGCPLFSVRQPKVEAEIYKTFGRSISYALLRTARPA